MTKEREYCPKVIDTKFTKPLFMTRKRCKGFDNFTKCCICKNLYEKGEVKIMASSIENIQDLHIKSVICNQE